MNPEWMRLAGWILRLYAARMVSKGCDDLDWPEWFPLAERVSLVRALTEANSNDAEEHSEDMRRFTAGSTCPPAWWLASFLADRMGAPDVDAF